MKSVSTATICLSLFVAFALTAQAQEKTKKKPFSYSESCRYELKPIFTKDQGMIYIQIPIENTETSAEEGKETQETATEEKTGFSKKFTAKSIAALLMGKGKKKESEGEEVEEKARTKRPTGTANPKIH